LAKKKIEKPKHKPTRRQLSRWQRQKRRQRFIIGIGITTIIVSLGFVLAGIYYQWYVPQTKPLKETVIEVNDTSFNMAYYIDALRFQLGDMPPEQISFFLDIIIDNIQQNELIRQEALELGIAISDIQVDEDIKNNDWPNNQAVRDISGAQLLVQELREGYFSEQVPTSTEQRYIMAMFLESENQTNWIRERLLSGEDFGQIASELSLDNYTLENNGDLGWRPKGIINDLLLTNVLEEYVFSYPVGDVIVPVYDADKTKNLGYWLIEVLERNEETGEVLVQAMKLASEDEAWMLLQRLAEAENFAELAEQHSQSWSEEDGAELGWLADGNMSDAFNDFVFNPETELNTYSEPILDEDITTKGGYWLFKVPDIGIREISNDDRDFLIEQSMEDWLETVYEDPENIINNYLDDEMREFAVSKF
jgi:hypothetical protein